MQIYDGLNPAVKVSVCIKPSLQASVYVNRKALGPSHELWNGLPTLCSTFQDVKMLLSKMSLFCVCSGNYEDKFSQVMPVGLENGHTPYSGMLGYREGDFGYNQHSVKLTSTIRSTRCELLTRGTVRCGPCSTYRATLRKNLSRTRLPKCSSPVGSISKKSHMHMSRLELVNKCNTLARQVKSQGNGLPRRKRMFGIIKPRFQNGDQVTTVLK